jgi:trans-aconitate 2-methyltransferase
MTDREKANLHDSRQKAETNCSEADPENIPVRTGQRGLQKKIHFPEKHVIETSIIRVNPQALSMLGYAMEMNGLKQSYSNGYSAAAKKSAFEFDGDKYKAASRHQREWGRQIIAELDLDGDERILDLGSGDGALTKELALRVPQGIVLGIDASEGMIAAARNLEGGNLRFERRNINEIDFNNEFDVIFSNATLHWIKDHRNLLARCGRALKKDGYFRFNFAGEGNCAALISVVRQIMHEEQFASHFVFFEWPWYMPGLSEYERMVSEYAEFDAVKIWEENADRLFSQDELVRWLDQPSLVPFLKHIQDATPSAAFRNAVVQAMLHVTKHSEREYFEAFRRLNVFARKR